MMIRNQTPKGGTELQFEFLRKHVDPAILNQVEITPLEISRKRELIYKGWRI